ncbi:hypothetical protein [Aequorivita antarctica]|uniref:Uncharacterized protein n=1 Tax=Aequorivita antarctica TaxID=153266 RepID=A0A5C6YYB3_9FLAO|nr:hypothetical protein [Aequorivita antarctica]TXD72718.1 hypothetical protein ESU54_10880 [Aequorivita antarctica]SRX74758.1 hypothetical protein AEQU3_01738 [Aequorivita antarctica]
MDVFADYILSYKSLYLIGLGVYLTLLLTSIIYRITKRKWKPVYVGIIVSLSVSLFHLQMANLPWDFSNISKVIILSIIIYGAAFALAASIAGIVRTTENQDERDVTYGDKN